MVFYRYIYIGKGSLIYLHYLSLERYREGLNDRAWQLCVQSTALCIWWTIAWCGGVGLAGPRLWHKTTSALQKSKELSQWESDAAACYVSKKDVLEDLVRWPFIGLSRP
jgi:hypothetical protein